MTKTVGIILMAGTGQRFGDDLPKQYHMLLGKPIYAWTLEHFIESNLFDEVLLITNTELETPKNVRQVEGGATRQESSYRALLACDPTTEIVVIHDAVRPFVTQKILEENIAGAKEYGAVDTCIPSADTIVYTPDTKNIESIPNRAHFMRGQTPQSFHYELILKAHQKTKQKNASDDCQLVLELGHKVHIVKGHEDNMKITTKRDLKIAEGIVFSRKI